MGHTGKTYGCVYRAHGSEMAQGDTARVFFRDLGLAGALLALSCAPSAPGHPPGNPDEAPPAAAVGPGRDRDAGEFEDVKPGPVTTSQEPAMFQTLPTDFGEFIVWVPGGTASRPLVVVAHGAGGSPEWHCQHWAEFIQERAFVLCIRGRPLGEGAFYFPQHHDLAERVQAGLVAFEGSHADRWTRGSDVYAGYSQGATMGALMLPGIGSRFPLALLIEGGYEQWPVKNAQHFAREGGRRVFFACGTTSCDRGAERSVRWLDRGGVAANRKTAVGAGHTPAGAVGAVAREGLTWLVEGAAPWETPQF